MFYATAAGNSVPRIREEPYQNQIKQLNQTDKIRDS